ncbi:hypothetical protein BDW59DRAFT_70502 [Aspergillus cavernicola]|uniref:Zn(2)-C6 fungal-type domain-containing protein n=1 Tax=Aspergillus cavernicola TaxID=176166 RepID=A0ABR4ID55_9EURO
MLFDRLRKKALSFFGEEDPSDLESILEARQLKELVFRENADLLYAREQPSATVNQLIFDITFPEFDKDGLSLDHFTDFPGFFDVSEAPVPDDLDEFDGAAIEDQFDQPSLPDLTLAALSRSPSPLVLMQSANSVIDKVQLSMAVQNLLVCSPCKKRRVKCDMNLLACRTCVKYGRDCCYWDSALSEGIPRKAIHTLHTQTEGLIEEVKGLSRSPEFLTGIANAVDLANSDPGTHALESNISSTILCPAASDAANPRDMIFLGATSAFSRLANSVGRCIPLPKGASISVFWTPYAA